MKDAPEFPFLTDDFSLKPGGIDFLGLRWVGLTIVGRHLIPEINNVTADMGTFFLGAWIPWKFRQLCSGKKDNTEKNYRLFRERAEVALSLTLRDESQLKRDEGLVRNRVGIQQRCSLPSKLTFTAAKRKNQNSLYAAAIYGPSLQAFGLVKTYRSLAENGRDTLNIPLTGDDNGTIEIVRGVESALKRTASFSLLNTLDSQAFDWRDIRKLGEHGLDPARYRALEFKPLKRQFRAKLLPADAAHPGFPRTLTTHLLIETLRRRPKLTSWEIRNAWYTGHFENGVAFPVRNPVLLVQRQRWACLLARQYQRYAIELFLWCFEVALKAGLRSVDEIVSHWIQRSEEAGGKLDGSFGEVLKNVAGSLWKKDESATSVAWNEHVHGAHEQFEFVEEPKSNEAVHHGLSMLAGWYWRMLSRQGDMNTQELMKLGDSDRISIAWFLQWLDDRRERPMKEFLKDVYSDLVFAQHMRIALSRYDGSAQRLRFLLGDHGIEPTVSARADLGGLNLPWMPDRLDTLIGLLCDCDVLVSEDGILETGPSAPNIS